MNSILYILNISKNPHFLATTDLMAEVVTVSRLNYKPDLLKIKNVCPLPTIPTLFSKTFEEICINRAQKIWQSHSKNNILNIFWSGGIDSTTALVALLKTRPNNCKIHVYCNLNSIAENNFFYKLLLKDQAIHLMSSSSATAPSELTLVTGELGDQIFGSDLLFKISSLFGFDSLFFDYSEIIPKLFIAKSGPAYGRLFYDRYQPIVNECPFVIKTTFDFIWWWNFTQKWQCVKYRKQSLLDPKLVPLHFFENDEFQLWSFFNHDKKISTTFESYKMPAKNFICSYDKNNSYRDKKKKIGSSFGNKIFFYALLENDKKIHTWSECNNLIEKNKLVP